MLNFPDRVTVTAQVQTGIDADTGLPTERDEEVWTLAPCAFAVLSAAEHIQAWGDGQPVRTPTVAASLTLPGYLALEGTLADYTVRIAGWRGAWRIRAERPGRDWTTYLLTR